MNAGNQEAKGVSRGLLLGTFGFFLVAGLLGAYFLTYKPLARVAAARTWEEVPCVILTSGIETSRTRGETPTYRVNITFSFSSGGREYVGRSYDLSVGTSSGLEAKEAVVAEYPPGTETTCYADPENPYEAVVDRSPGPYLLWALFPLPFALGGLIGIVGIRWFKTALDRTL